MATVTSPDGNYTAVVVIVQDPDSGRYVVDIQVSSATTSSGDTLDVRVNGNLVFEGLAAESTGG
jgi:hypothetical protein